MKKILAICIFLIFPFIVQAAEKAVWFEAEGTAYMGETETQMEVKDRAKHDAEKKALEKAVGVFIKSHTIVSNRQIAEKLIYAAVRGKIEKVNIVNEAWDQKDRNLYRVKLNALIQPVYPADEEGNFIKLSLSKANVKEGDEINIFYQVNSDSYVYIFSVAADGSVTLLLPNLIHKNNFTKARIAHQFPPIDSPIHLKAMLLPNYSGSFAEEKIKIIATKRKEELLGMGFKEGFFQVYDAKSTGMISELVRRLNQIELTDWAEATAVYNIIRQTSNR